MVEVIFEDLTKKFGRVVAVDNLNLRVKDGEFLVLLGPSGCGKTTALRLVAGLETPTSGNIYIGDAKVNDLSPKDRNIAMVFQSYALYAHMTVYNNLAFPLKARKKSKDEINERVKEIAKMLGLENLLGRKPRELRGGQAQRGALGRALVREPQVFLMDEPLSNLDAKLRVQMRTELQRLHRKLKTTTIYVTHDQEEAMTIGKRIAVMNNGILEQVGTPREIYRNPENLFVGGFIGSPAMNMLGGSLIERNGKTIVDMGDFIYEPSKSMGGAIMGAETPEIVLGVRPEDLTITKRGQKNAIRAKIDIIELVGRELHVHLRVGGKSLVAITSPAQNLNVGKEVWLSLDEKQIHLFDKKSKKAIFRYSKSFK